MADTSILSLITNVSSSATLLAQPLTHYHFGSFMDTLLTEKLWAPPHFEK